MTTTKHMPATPLPWSRKDGHYQRVRTEDIDYFIHAANAYPRLVKTLKDARRDLWRALGGDDDAANAKRADYVCSGIDALLRELGEKE